MARPVSLQPYFHTMARIFLFVFFGGFIINSIPAQNVRVNVYYLHRQSEPEGDTISYNLSRKLTWKDFQGTPVPNYFGSAVTASGFAFSANTSYDEEDITLNFYVYTFFTKKDSWRKPNINDPYHLEHEQRHFDITYLSAVKFTDQLKKAKFNKKNYTELPNQIFQNAQRENEELQHQYDRETEHSVNRELQEKWNQKIDKMLSNVKDKYR